MISARRGYPTTRLCNALLKSFGKRPRIEVFSDSITSGHHHLACKSKTGASKWRLLWIVKVLPPLGRHLRQQCKGNQLPTTLRRTRRNLRLILRGGSTTKPSLIVFNTRRLVCFWQIQRRALQLSTCGNSRRPQPSRSHWFLNICMWVRPRTKRTYGTMQQRKQNNWLSRATRLADLLDRPTLSSEQQQEVSTLQRRTGYFSLDISQLKISFESAQQELQQQQRTDTQQKINAWRTDMQNNDHKYRKWLQCKHDEHFALVPYNGQIAQTNQDTLRSDLQSLGDGLVGQQHQQTAKDRCAPVEPSATQQR